MVQVEVPERQAARGAMGVALVTDKSVDDQWFDMVMSFHRDMKAALEKPMMSTLKATQNGAPALAAVQALLLLAGEVEAMFNEAMGSARRSADEIYDVYTDGYNTGFRHAGAVLNICKSCPDYQACIGRPATVCAKLGEKDEH